MTTQDLVAEATVATAPARLAALSRSRLTAVRAAVARNPATPTELLEVLVEDRHHRPRYAVTENPSPHAVAVALTASRSDVREILAQRTDLDDTASEALLGDPRWQVRQQLARSTDRADLLAVLARSPEHHVRASVVHNEACSDEDVDLLVRDPRAEVRVSVASATRRLTEDHVQRLLRDRSAAVRWTLLSGFALRRDLAEALRDDPDEMTRRQALAHLSPEHAEPTAATYDEGDASVEELFDGDPGFGTAPSRATGPLDH